MNFILVPGFWLTAESWSDVSRKLSASGVNHVALTLPGLERGGNNARQVRLVDHIESVRLVVESFADDVVLVGHSGAGPICHAAAAQATDKVRRIVHVDTWPLPPGMAINSDMATGTDIIELPDWSVFEPEDLVDMNDDIRDRLRRESLAQPAAVARDRFPAMDDRRLSVPTTIICCEFSSEQFRKWVSAGDERLAEVARLHDVSYIDLPTGHWPQFTKPVELAAALVSLA